MSDEKRKAVIIGIDGYADPKIPKLKGATNDANDLCKILKRFGGFDIPESHFLLDEKATYSAIRKAISDLFWKTDPCDFALFYFSGHGDKDAYEDGYIIPHDMSDDDFFSFGINMNTKKVALNSKTEKVLVILDCCYSGVSTKDGKSISTGKILLDQYLAISNEEEKNKGKIIIASSGDYEKSREIQDCYHVFEPDNPHPHGIFTFHLLEGLNGKAGEKTKGSGIITLGNIIRYVDSKLTEIDQRPKIYTADASLRLIDSLRIIVNIEKFRDHINDIIKKAKAFWEAEDPRDKINAVKEIKYILEDDSENKEAIEIKNEIDKTFGTYHSLVMRWLNENDIDLRREMPNAAKEINKVSRKEYFCFSKISTSISDKRIINLLALLCAVSIEKMTFDEFIERCRDYDNPESNTIESANASLSTSKSQV